MTDCSVSQKFYGPETMFEYVEIFKEKTYDITNKLSTDGHKIIGALAIHILFHFTLFCKTT
jgi:hypothetical protein